MVKDAGHRRETMDSTCVDGPRGAHHGVPPCGWSRSKRSIPTQGATKPQARCAWRQQTPKVCETFRVFRGEREADAGRGAFGKLGSSRSGRAGRVEPLASSHSGRGPSTRVDALHMGCRARGRPQGCAPTTRPSARSEDRMVKDAGHRRETMDSTCVRGMRGRDRKGTPLQSRSCTYQLSRR